MLFYNIGGEKMEHLFLFIRLAFAMGLALFFGRHIARIKLPAILAWLISGMILGPYALNLMNLELFESTNFQILSSIIETSVGLMIGTELVIDKLRIYGKKILISTIIQSMGTFLLVSLAFLVVFSFTELPFYTAFIFGGIALATAPTPALSIVEEFQTDGPVTRTLLPMAALDDIIAFVVFFTIISLVSGHYSSAATPLALTLFVRIILPILLGIFVGLPATYFLKKEQSNQRVFFTTFIFVLIASFIGLIVNYFILSEPILNFMLVGLGFSASFANLVSLRQSTRVMYLFNPILRFSLILLILNLGAGLDYRLIFSSGIYTLVYILSRALGKYSFAYLGTRLTGFAPTVQKYLGLTLLPHSGTSLIFTGVVVSSLASFDPELTLVIQGTISAAAILNELLAVILSKKAFDWAGETGQGQ